MFFLENLKNSVCESNEQNQQHKVEGNRRLNISLSSCQRQDQDAADQHG